MRKPVDNSNICLRTHPDVSKGAALFFHDRLPVGHLGKKTDRRADESAPEGSQRFNGEPRMRNRLHVSFLGAAVRRGRHRRDRSSATDRTRLRSAVGCAILAINV